MIYCSFEIELDKLKNNDLKLKRKALLNNIYFDLE